MPPAYKLARFLWPVAFMVGLVLGCTRGAQALTPRLDVSQYAHTAWKIRDGFTKGTILSIAQTADGYLWLGTEFGLHKFDGVRAVPWHPPSGELPSNYISTLLVGHDGTLWIGTLNGLVSWKNNSLNRYPEVAGAYVLTVHEDRQQTIWVGTSGGSKKGGLCAFRDGTMHCVEDEVFGENVDATYQDREGNLWVAGQHGLLRWAQGAKARYVLPSGEVEINSLVEDDEGTLLLAANDGLKRLVAGKIEDYSLSGVTGQIWTSRFLRCSDGSLWIGTDQGLLHLHQGKVDRFREVNGLSGDRVSALFEDREKNIWVATASGLDRFREYAIPTIGRSQGLSSSGVYAVQAMPDGSIWVATTEGLNRWANGNVTIYRNRSAAGQSRRVEKTELTVSSSLTEISNSGLAGTARSLGVDDSRRLWAVTDEGVFYFDRNKFTKIQGFDGDISSVSPDGRGNMWIFQRKRLVFWSPHAAIREFPLSQFTQNVIRTELADPDRDGLWLGFYRGGIVYLKDGKVLRSYGTADGLSDGRVNRLRFGPSNEVLAATEHGLSRIKGGHIDTLNSKNGLPCDEAYWSMEDDDHNVWLYMPCGLARIARADWEAWVNNPKQSVKPKLFDTSDGVRTVGLYAYHASRASKSLDGKLWFSPSDGVSVIDPHHLPFNAIPPPVQIERVTVDQKAFDASHNLRLPPLVRNLEINYTALSFVAPETVLFRYKLDGVDHDWQDVRTRRQAFYTNLAPGKYRFRVVACNNDGVWNETGDTLDFSIAPAWFQTNVFRVSCVAVLVLLLWIIYQLRVRGIQLRSAQLAMMNAELGMQVAENATLLTDLQLQVGLLQHLPVSAWTLKPDGTPDFVNQVWLDFAGQTPDLVRSHPEAWMTAIHPEDREMASKSFWEGVHTGTGFAFETRSLRAQDRVYRWHLQQAVVLRDAEGKLLKFVGTTTDIDDQKRTEEALRQAQGDLARINRSTTMGELAASLAHEISQPITGVITNGNVSLRKLGRDKPDLNEVREAVARILRDGQRAAEILTRIRSQFEKGSRNRELLDLSEMIRETAGLLRDEAARYNISVRTELADDLPQIIGDRVQLQQVAMNLIVNSIEAMKDTNGIREMVIKSQRTENELILVSVSDTGIGFPMHLAEQIFDPFFTTKPHGTGMGLRISRSIIENHGGRLWAEGAAGRGAAFQFNLPVVIADCE